MKFFLPFLTLLSIVAAGKTDSAERKLQGLSTNKWIINSPVDLGGNPIRPIQYDTTTGEFEMTLHHGTGKNTANMRIFANPSGPDNANPAGACMTNGGEEIGTAGSISWLDNEDFAPFSLGGNTGSTYSFKLSPDVVDAAKVYKVDAAPDYIVNFCLVFGLTDSLSGDTISFYEVGLLVDIDMSNNFEIKSFKTQALVPTTDDASNDFEVYYLACPGASQNPFDQFKVISICLCPTLKENLNADPPVKTDLVEITGVDEVLVTGLIPDTDLTAVQEIFEGGEAMTSAAGQFAMTQPDHLVGCLQVDFLTDESFFPNNVGSGELVTLTIEGSAILEPKSLRHLRNSRALVKAGEEATFTAEIQVIPGANEESASGRWTVTSTAGVVLGAAGALMI